MGCSIAAQGPLLLQTEVSGHPERAAVRPSFPGEPRAAGTGHASGLGQGEPTAPGSRSCLFPAGLAAGCFLTLSHG